MQKTSLKSIDSNIQIFVFARITLVHLFLRFGKMISNDTKVLIFGVLCGFFLSFWLLKVDQKNLTSFSTFISNYEGLSFGSSSAPNISMILDQEVKILCFVITMPTNKFRWKPIRETWGKKCTKLLFMSSETYYNEDDGFEVVGLSADEGRQNLWAKTKESFIYAYRNYYEDYDWFMKVDDDT